VPSELVDKALRPLWACWRALLSARNKREPLELDLPERRVVLDEKGRIMSVAPRERLDAHRLVEDYMIAANVAAAKALERKKAPVMYRVHEAPGREKLVALKDYLATFDLEFALGQVIRPATFNRIIERIGEEHPARPEIMEQVLRTQMQARYSPEPFGHFGLALPSYAHFTSPIRRYADLLVHRALVSFNKLGDGVVPAAILGNEYFRYDEASRALVGEETGETYHVGQHLELKLVEANPASGALRFELPEGKFAAPPRLGPRRDRVRGGPKRGRPANIRHQGKRR
jgi:exoribonuclease R